jgi:hypothetical protein
MLLDLALRFLRERGSGSLTVLRKGLKISFGVAEEVFHQLRRQQLIDVKSSVGQDFNFALTTTGRELAADGCEYATLGLSPLSTRAEVAPFHNPLWLRMLLTWLRKHGKRFYNFEGLDAFKAKLQPQRWEPVFAICDQSHVSFRSLYAIASAFSGNAPIRLLIGGLGKALEAEYGRARGFISDKNSSLSTFK